MGKGLVLFGLSVCALLLGGTWARAESVDEIGRLITEKMRAVKSFSAKTQTEGEMSGPGGVERRTSTGSLELVRSDGKVFLRNESRESVRTDAGGEITTVEGFSLAVMDGTGYVYSYVEGGDQKTAYKAKSRADWDANPIEGFKAACEIELLPEEIVDGAAVYVIKLTPKAGTGGEGSALQYFRKDCGYPVKMVQFDAAGKQLASAIYTDIKVDQEISPERFVFTPPEGVSVIDLTAMTSPGASAPASAPTDSQPASAPVAAAEPAPAQSAPATTAPAATEASTQPAQTQAAEEKPKKGDGNKGETKKDEGKKSDSKKSDGKKKHKKP